MIVALVLWCLGVAAMSAFAVSMRRHHEAIFSTPLTARRVYSLRAVAWLGVAAGLWVALRAVGGQIGPVLWISTLSVSAPVVAVLLCYRPRATVPLSIAGAVAALCLLGWR